MSGQQRAQVFPFSPSGHAGLDGLFRDVQELQQPGLLGVGGSAIQVVEHAPATQIETSSPAFARGAEDALGAQQHSQSVTRPHVSTEQAFAAHLRSTLELGSRLSLSNEQIQRIIRAEAARLDGG